MQGSGVDSECGGIRWLESESRPLDGAATVSEVTRGLHESCFSGAVGPSLAGMGSGGDVSNWQQQIRRVLLNNSEAVKGSRGLGRWLVPGGQEVSCTPVKLNLPQAFHEHQLQGQQGQDFCITTKSLSLPSGPSIRSHPHTHPLYHLALWMSQATRPSCEHSWLPASTFLTVVISPIPETLPLFPVGPSSVNPHIILLLPLKSCPSLSLRPSHSLGLGRWGNGSPSGHSVC